MMPLGDENDESNSENRKNFESEMARGKIEPNHGQSQKETNMNDLRMHWGAGRTLMTKPNDKALPLALPTEQN